MRIAVITNDGPQGGGAGRIASMYSDALIRHGHEVRTWGPNETFHQLAKMSSLGRLFFHLGDLRAHQDVVSQILEWHPNALLTHNLTGCGFATPKLIRRRGIRWVHMLHDVQLFEPSGQIIEGESMPLFHWLWRKKWSMLRRIAMGEPNEVVSPTKWLLEAHHAFGWFRKTQTVVIPNPIEQKKNINEINRDAKQIIFVGRVDWDKGIDLLIEAWLKVRDTASRLVIVGDGAWLSRIRALKDSKIEVCGRQTSAEVARHLSASGILVVPSRVHENQPTVILEGLAAGCRIIATNVGGVKETLDGEGDVVEPNSVSALVTSINEALDDKSSQTNAVRVLAAHDPDLCVSALTGALRSNL